MLLNPSVTFALSVHFTNKHLLNYFINSALSIVYEMLHLAKKLIFSSQLNMKRQLDIAIISDVHLGTYGCHAMELLSHLKSIKLNMLILNGDFIDIWQFKKSFFPKEYVNDEV